MYNNFSKTVSANIKQHSVNWINKFSYPEISNVSTVYWHFQFLKPQDSHTTKTVIETQLFTVTDSVFPAQPQVACYSRSFPLEGQRH